MRTRGGIILISDINLYKWLISYLAKYKKKYFLLLLVSLLISSLQLVAPQAIKYIIDSIIPGGELNRLYIILVALAIGVMLLITFQSISNILLRYIQEYPVADLRISLLEHLRKLGVPYIEKVSTGAILNLFNTEITAIQEFYRRILPEITRSVILLLVSLGYLVSIDWRLSLLIIPSFLINYFIGPYFSKLSAKYGNETNTLRGDYNKKVYESIVSVREIKLNNAYDWDNTNFIKSFINYKKSEFKLLTINHTRAFFRNLVINIGFILIILVSSYLTIQGELTIGSFVSYLFCYFIVMDNLLGMVNILTEQQILKFQIRKVFDFSNLKPSVDDNSVQSEDKVHEEFKGEISIRELSFNYGTNFNTINGLNIEIKPGEKIGLVGESGCGKSTLLKLLMRFYLPVKGEIRIDGIPINNIGPHHLRENIGIIFQDPFIYADTVAQNIRYGNPLASDEEIIKAAMDANANEFIMRLPNKYQTIISEKGSSLSGGEKQRIAIARMFLRNPKIVLTDEATSALDNFNEHQVILALNKLFENRTTISIAHRIASIKDYDRILFMKNGNIAEEGTFDELFKSEGEFYNMIKSRRKLM